MLARYAGILVAFLAIPPVSRTAVLPIGALLGGIAKTTVLDDCRSCMNFVTLIRRLEDNAVGYGTVNPFVTSMCNKYVKADGKHPGLVCPRISQIYGPTFWFVVTSVSLTSREVCRQLHRCSPSKTNHPRGLNDVIGVPKLGDVTVPKQARREYSKKSRDGGGVLRIVMLTDVHVESNYKQGAATKCGTYGCCQLMYPGKGSAGEWGDYNCDIPPKTMDYIADYITKMSPKPDFIIYGGDTTAHHIRRQTWLLQATEYGNFNDYLAWKFADWNVYPVIGNHDTYPNSLFYQDNVRYKAMTAMLATWWGRLFNVTSGQAENIAHSGYYTALVSPGLRILAFNSNYWLLANWYFLLNDKVKAYKDQLNFMVKVLTDARANDEKVILTGHVPPNDLTAVTIDYGDLFIDLVSRFHDVIVLQLFGHSHHNEFSVISHPVTKKAIGVHHVIGSVTTFGKNNPSFSVFYLDNATFDLVDHESYFFDIVEANAGNPKIKRQFTSREDYKMKDLSPVSYQGLVTRFANDDNLLMKYIKFTDSQSQKSRECGSRCRKSLRCHVQTISITGYNACLES